MQNLLSKLNYKDQRRIAVLNGDESFYNSVSNVLENVIIDKEIDLRCPYSFIIIFVKSVSEIDSLTPIAIHNLISDGILWFCYPKKSSRRFSSNIDRDNGWKVLNDAGLFGVRMVSIDDDWSALRFRNVKYIKSSSGKYGK